MIPKILHYCWFGKGMMPQSQRDYIKGWQRLMPDYQLMRWDESNFDVNICPYTAEAYKLKKWAFVSDVARLYALVNYGGIYMDTDVEVYSSFDRFLHHKAFSGIEIYQDEFERDGKPLLDENNQPKVRGTNIPCCGFLSAVLGTERGSAFISECFHRYMNRKPYLEDGSFNSIVVDGLLAIAAVDIGFRYEDSFQDLGIVTLYPSKVFPFAGVPKTPEAVVYHYTAWSWMPKTKKQNLFILLDKIGVLKPYRQLKRKIKQLLGKHA